MSAFTHAVRQLGHLLSLKKHSDKIQCKTDESGSNKKGVSESLIELLLNPEIQKVGIWGMGGVGKTYNVKYAIDMVRETNSGRSFDHIVFVSVTHEWSIRDVRNDIIKELSMEEELGENGGASLLHQRLKGTRFLLVLDDLWETISLEELGIPEPTKENGCKLFLITRIHNVCELMGAQAKVKVPTFSREDAWELFCEEVGSMVLLPNIQPLAKSIVDECGYLPLAVKEMGKAMNSSSDEVIWLNSLSIMMQSRPLNSSMELVFRQLKLSYDQLKDVLKHCFLACTFFGDNHEISIPYLVENWMMCGYVDIADEMLLSEAYEKGLHLLKELLDASMLELSKDRDHITINNMMRHMGLMIKSSKFIMRDGLEQLEGPEEEEWKEAEMISLKASGISSLHQSPDCPNLTVLILYNNLQLRSISPSFFEQMAELHVLDLSWAGLDSLPESISKLTNLHYLDLAYCRCLKNLACLGSLKQLLVLDLSVTPIEEMPEELGNLTRLRHLFLSATVNLSRIAGGIFNKLSKLEILQMRASSYAWQHKSKEKEASLQELLGLKCLSTLVITVKGVGDFEFLRNNAVQEIWKNTMGVECYIRGLSVCMKFEGKFNSWSSERQEEDLAGSMLSRAASTIEKQGKRFFDM